MSWFNKLKWFDQDNKFNIVHFKFGKERKPITHYMKIGVILRLSLNVLSFLPGVDEERMFNLIDEAQLHLGVDLLNDYIIRDKELLTYRIRRRVQKAIEEYKSKNES